MANIRPQTILELGRQYNISLPAILGNTDSLRSGHCQREPICELSD